MILNPLLDQRHRANATPPLANRRGADRDARPSPDLGSDLHSPDSDRPPSGQPSSEGEEPEGDSTVHTRYNA